MLAEGVAIRGAAVCSNETVHVSVCRPRLRPFAFSTLAMIQNKGAKENLTRQHEARHEAHLPLSLAASDVGTKLRLSKRGSWKRNALRPP